MRATAREAGVSHAAPKNHFGNLTGLLSDLAAVGFKRFRAELTNYVQPESDPAARMKALGMGYLSFAKTNPALFLLMFRNERLDYSRPALSETASAAFNVLSTATSERRAEKVGEDLTSEQMADIIGSWSLVHGFSMLLLDGRLDPLLERSPEGTKDTDLLAAIFSLKT